MARKHEQKALLELARGRDTMFKLNGGVAAFGLLAVFLEDGSYTWISLAIILVLNIGTYYEDQKKLTNAISQDLEEMDLESKDTGGPNPFT